LKLEITREWWSQNIKTRGGQRAASLTYIEPQQNEVQAVDMADSDKEERTPEEVDDQFRALMEGLRTTIPGVMTLFSFLLILPFQAPFGDLTTANNLVFYIAFFSAALSSILLIAPSVHQRVRAPISGIKRRTLSHVMTATRLAIVGTVLFLVTISSVVFLISSIVIDDLFASIATAVAAGVAGWAWFYLPLVSFRN
jgi:hypothetical protein